jgi:hypothetical protein
MKIKQILPLAIACMVFAACKKDKSDSTHLVKTNATVYNSGAVAADGCSWTINVDGISYHPDNLADEFKVDKSKVTIDADILEEKFICGWGTKLTTIHLTGIVRQ